MSTRADATRDQIEAQLAGPLHGLGLDLEAVELSSAGKRSVLRIAVDQDGGVIHDDLVQAERAVSAALDGSQVMGERSFTLEVTSRGVDRPLSLPRHWRRNHDRLVAITHVDGSTFTGRICGHDEDSEGGVHLQIEGETTQVPYRDIKTALIQIEFNRPTASQEDEA